MALDSSSEKEEKDQIVASYGDCYNGFYSKASAINCREYD
jgi:hypothetical protein